MSELILDSCPRRVNHNLHNIRGIAMKKYTAPELTCYGGLAQLTAFDVEDSPEDFYYYSQPGTSPIDGTGSNNGCVTPNQVQCL